MPEPPDIRTLVKLHAEWLRDRRRPRNKPPINFTGAVFSLVELSRPAHQGLHGRGPNLRNANLQGAVMRAAGLRGAWLDGVDLTDMDLTGSDLRKARMTCTILAGAKLASCDLRNAYLLGADLRGCDLRGADIRGADLSGVIVDERTDLRVAFHAGVKFVGVDLRVPITDWNMKSYIKAHKP